MRLMRVLLVFVVAIDVAACAQHPLTATAAAGLKGRRLATTARPPTHLWATEPGMHTIFMSGIAGAVAIELAMTNAGARIVRENGIANSAPHMAQQLSDDLRRLYDLKLEPKTLYVTYEDPTRITAVYPATDLVLDVWVDSLSLEPFFQEPSRYRLKYVAHVRLIDAKFVYHVDGTRGRVIARGTCKRIPEETHNAPTYDEFLANGAQRLKRELDIAAQFCAEEFRSKVLTASPAP